MKKIVIIMVAVVIGLTSSIGVFAAGITKSSNMDVETFLETKFSRIEEALENEEITEDDAIQIREHIQEVVADGTYGKGPENTNREECDEDCIFQDGLRLQKMDGTGNQDGARVQGLGNGSGMGRNGACILD